MGSFCNLVNYVACIHMGVLWDDDVELGLSKRYYNINIELVCFDSSYHCSSTG